MTVRRKTGPKWLGGWRVAQASWKYSLPRGGEAYENMHRSMLRFYNNRRLIVTRIHPVRTSKPGHWSGVRIEIGGLNGHMELSWRIR